MKKYFAHLFNAGHDHDFTNVCIHDMEKNLSYALRIRAIKVKKDSKEDEG